MIGENFSAAIDAASRRVRFRRRVERAQRDCDRVLFAQFLRAAFFPHRFSIMQYCAHGRRTGPGGGVFRRLQIARPSRRKNKDAPGSES